MALMMKGVRMNPKRAARRAALVVTLVLLGWVVGRGQSSVPEFELIVDAPSGETTIQCVRGCKLAWVERGVNPSSTPIPAFTYRCNAARCSSGRVGAWSNP